MSPPLLAVNDLKKHFPVPGGFLNRDKAVVHAVDGVSFEIARGETLSLVGESGCGKSTVAKTLLRLLPPTSGQIVLKGRRVDDLSPGAFRPLRQAVQIVFQDPFSSLNPRMRVRAALAEPIRNFGLATSSADVSRRLEELMRRVGLPRDALDRFPHEFSGGQRQRIGIARALALEPEVLVADEPVSALDVSVQAQVLALLADLRERLGLSMLFITHDLRVAAQVCDRIAVMKDGVVVEEGAVADVFGAPRDAYTQALLASVPGRNWTPHVVPLGISA